MAYGPEHLEGVSQESQLESRINTLQTAGQRKFEALTREGIPELPKAPPPPNHDEVLKASAEGLRESLPLSVRQAFERDVNPETRMTEALNSFAGLEPSEAQEFVLHPSTLDYTPTPQEQAELEKIRVALETDTLSLQEVMPERWII